MAVFAYRTEELSLEKVRELFVETKADRKIIEEVKSESPTIVVGSRGTGKSFLLKVAEGEMRDAFPKQRIIPVYVSFKESSLVQSRNDHRFVYWMMAKLCTQILRSLREYNVLEPARASLLLSSGRTAQGSDLGKISEAFENSWRHPGDSIDVSSVPDVDDLVGVVDEICGENEIERLCILFDEAAHVFRLEQQHAFFSLFRDLRSPRISCNAAVYPGITSFGPTFEMTHDATLLRLERGVLDDGYVSGMREIIVKQVDRKLKTGTADDKAAAQKLNNQIAKAGGNFEKNFPLLAYCAHGNPRHLLKTIGLLTDFGPSNVEGLVKSYYREEIWKEHTALGEKFKSYKPIVDWGREFLESTVIPQLEKTSETSIFFWVSRDSPSEVAKALALLSYVGLVEELDRGIRVTRRELGTRYMIHFGSLLAQAASPLRQLDQILPTLRKKRMVEFHKGTKSFKSIETVRAVPDDLLSIEVVRDQLQKPVDVLDLTTWQKSTLNKNGFATVQSVLEAGETTLREKIHMVGEVRARQMSNAAKSAILEYLLG